MSTYEEYRSILDTLPFDEQLEWMDDCRGMATKLEEMKRIYGKER